MKKIMVATVLITCMLANTAFAGGRHGGGINPLWVPIAVLSTLAVAATVASAPPPPPVVHERTIYYEPRQTVIYEEPRRTIIYEEPRYYRHERHYDHDRDYYAPRYRDYR